jgi:hypothetical protein
MHVHLVTPDRLALALASTTLSHGFRVQAERIFAIAQHRFDRLCGPRPGTITASLLTLTLFGSASLPGGAIGVLAVVGALRLTLALAATATATATA